MNESSQGHLVTACRGFAHAAHTYFLYLLMLKKKLKLVDWLTPPPLPPPLSLRSNPHGDRGERKRSKVSRRDCKGERER